MLVVLTVFYNMYKQSYSTVNHSLLYRFFHPEKLMFWEMLTSSEYSSNISRDKWFDFKRENGQLEYIQLNSENCYLNPVSSIFPERNTSWCYRSCWIWWFTYSSYRAGWWAFVVRQAFNLFWFIFCRPICRLPVSYPKFFLFFSGIWFSVIRYLNLKASVSANIINFECC